MTDKNYDPYYASDGSVKCESLRDYFAAKAMQGLLANTEMGDAALHDSAKDWLKDIAGSAYEFADAMLKARGE